MNSINDFINEKLKINSKSVVKDNRPIEIQYNKNNKLCCEESDLTDISMYAEQLPIKPTAIKVGVQGNVKICFDYELTSSWYQNKRPYINISKPDRYHGSFKITMQVGNYAPYEYPMGNKYMNSHGDLLLPDVEAVFNQINKQWKKRDLTTVYKRYIKI